MSQQFQTPKYVEHPLIWPGKVEFRLYQKRIADAASERNTIVILPTALGKTVISAIVSANILYNYRDMKVLVMAPTRPLVMQHRESFLRTLKLREGDTAVVTGLTPADSRRAFWNSGVRVFFATPQVVRNDLHHRILTLEDFGLLVFDECHRAVGEYAYTDIAKMYVSQAVYPLILGLTASPGSNMERIREVCRNLYIEHVEFRSEEDPDVKPYIQPIEIEWKRVDLPAEYAALKSQIRRMLNERLEKLTDSGLLNRKPQNVTRKRLIEVGEELRYMLEAESIEEERGKIYAAIVNQSIALTLFHMLELLETQGIHTLKAFMMKVESERWEKHSYAALTGSREYKALKALVNSTVAEHPKVDALKNAVREQLSKKPSSRMIVFTQYRDTVNHIVDVLRKTPPVRVERFVGQASKNMDKGLTQIEQAERLRMLENGELNVLVATSIAEEGLDIPSVDHVIFYEPIPSEIRYIQRRGRTGRKTPGKVTILAANESLDMIYLYAGRKRLEKMRRTVQTLNDSLQQIIRKRAKPPQTPLTPEQLMIIEREAVRFEAEPEIFKTEAEALRELNRKAARLAKTLYMRLLEAGAEGVSLNRLSMEAEFEDAAPKVLEAALNMLMRDGKAEKIGPEKIALTSAVKHSGKNVYEIEVEKIYPGSAVVIVNDKWRAKLEPHDYNGPTNLIRKRSRFKAVARLYRLNGTLRITIKEVIQKL